jgi:hypothetical protein
LSTPYLFLDTAATSTRKFNGKKMHVKEIYVIFIHLFDSGILLIIDLNKKKREKGGGEFFCNNRLINNKFRFSI